MASGHTTQKGGLTTVPEDHYHSLHYESMQRPNNCTCYTNAEVDKVLPKRVLKSNIVRALEFCFQQSQNTTWRDLMLANSSMEPLAPKRSICGNRAIAKWCHCNLTKYTGEVSQSWPETQGKEMRMIMYSWASTLHRLLNQWYGVHCWCSVVKMFTICVTPSLLWTLMEPWNIKGWGCRVKTVLSRSILKSVLIIQGNPHVK